jgi:predicted TIM-barrel fold metal-dependent hydrolase
MVAAIKASSKTAIIWAHAGSYMSASDVRDILRDHPNVSFDLSAKNPACCGAGLRENPLVGLFGMDKNWQELFGAYPDRFLVGVDFYAASQFGAAREAGEFYRTILTQLAPTTARKIGYENADRLYGLK